MNAEDILFSMARDVSETELNQKSFSLWEIPIYLGLLAAMFLLQICLGKIT